MGEVYTIGNKALGWWLLKSLSMNSRFLVDYLSNHLYHSKLEAKTVFKAGGVRVAQNPS